MRTRMHASPKIGALTAGLQGGIPPAAGDTLSVIVQVIDAWNIYLIL